MATFTVLGANGRIGSALAGSLRAGGHDVHTDGMAGHVVYAIGLTADFRERPIEAMQAHVGHLGDVLRDESFESFTYLSSTRVYRSIGDAAEDAQLTVDPADPDDVYTLSKLAGESLVHAVACDRARVLRLSNVIGTDTASSDFLPSIVRDAVSDGHIVLRTSAGSAKDYIALDDVIELIPRIASGGRHTVYNVASGEHTTHGEICDLIRDLTGCTIEVAPDAPTIVFPAVSVDRLKGEFGFGPRSALEAIARLVEGAR